LYRPFVVSGFLKVHRQFRSDLTRLVTVGSFEPLSNPHMKLLPLTDRNPFVPEVLIQRMSKAITSCMYTIGPLAIPSRAQKVLPTYQCRTAFFHLCCVDPDGSGHSGGGEL